MKDKKKAKKELMQDMTALRKQSDVLTSLQDGSKAIGTSLEDPSERYRAAVEFANDPAVIVGKGQRLFFNEKLLQFLGYDKPEEIKDKPLYFAVHPDDMKRARELVLMRQGGKEAPSRYELRLVRKDGSMAHAEASASLISYEGEPASLVYFRDISDRRRAEDAIRESEERFRSYIELTQDLVYVVNRKGLFTYVNPQFEKISGWSFDELLGRPFPMVAAQEQAETLRDFFKKGMRGIQMPSYEVDLIHKDGRRVPVEFLVTTLFDREAKATGRLGVGRDITARKRAEAALQRSEQEKAHIFGAMSELVFYLDTDLKIISVNPAAARLFKLTTDQLQGRYCYEVLHRRTEACPVCPALKALQTGEPQVVYDFQSYGRWWILRGHPVWSDGKIIGVVEIVTDITERKMAEDALRESEEKYRLLVENAGDAIFIVQNDLVRFSNTMFSRLSGYSLDKTTDRPFIDFIHSADRLNVMERYKQRIRGEREPYYEFRIITREGETKWVEINSVLIEWQGRPAVLAFMRDITTQKTLESQLLQAQKLEALGTLAGGIAHDFNNLLSGILGHASLLEMDYETTRKQKERLDGIKYLVKSASSLTSQLLGFARMGRYEVKTMNINELLEKTSAMFGRTRKEIIIQKRFAEDLMPVEADRTQWEQVFMNLFVNAWQAMPGGGSITIETSNVTLQRKETRRSYMKPGDYVKISVTDTGVGMDEATMDRIFEPFFTTKEMGRGTGLGLAMVYGIVKGHKGYVDVQSAKGRGTTFNIYLPATEKHLVREVEEVGGDIARGNETVLLVDDEEQIIEVVGDVLEALGYTLFVARNGSEAIHLYQENRNKIDLVILDLIMPGMSGGETFEKLKDLNGDIKVILSSGYSLGGEAANVMQKGCRAFIQKPFNVTELSQKVREVLD